MHRFYGPRHVKLAAESGAIEKLMITVPSASADSTTIPLFREYPPDRAGAQDTMFRNRDLNMRAAYVALVETVKASRGEVCVRARSRVLACVLVWAWAWSCCP
jgi:hypothetical protein